MIFNWISVLSGVGLGYLLGWWIRAMHYKVNRMIRTQREWYADPLVRIQQGIDESAYQQDILFIPNDDANVPWWKP